MGASIFCESQELLSLPVCRRYTHWW